MLVVVDMQPMFKNSLDDQLAKNIIREVKKAITKREGIVILEYAEKHSDQAPMGYGPTRGDIMRSLWGYDRWVVCHKHQDNGACEVVNISRKRGFNLRRISVCGINTNACVKDTTRGLSLLLPDAVIRVVADACLAAYGYHGWAKHLPNVTWK